MIPWLASAPGADVADAALFPTVDDALADPPGLLCAGGALTPRYLLAAYRRGIFPWFSPGQPILWWSPDPRMVLVPSEFHLSRSLDRALRRGGYTIRVDHDFAAVIAACAGTPRPGQDGTWITRAMQDAYCELHELGWAHSVETWVDGRLVGGLYGLAIGHMFYGESMFSHRADASKLAAAHLARWLDARGFGMIDCQMHTDHLASLGARMIPRSEFNRRLAALTATATPPCRWPERAAACEWPWRDRRPAR